MSLLDIELGALDSLVKELLDNIHQYPQDKDAAYHIKTSFSQGDLDTALNVLREQSPEIRNDLRVLFLLHKQRFVELCRHQHANDDQIIACARQQLAPLALDAYPEAYTEFKTALTLLLYVNSSPQITSSNQDSPGADSPHGQPPIPAALKHLLDISTREELAEVVYHTIRQLTRRHESQLHHLMLFLLHVHQQHTSSGSSNSSRNGNSSLPPIPGATRVTRSAISSTPRLFRRAPFPFPSVPSTQSQPSQLSHPPSHSSSPPATSLFSEQPTSEQAPAQARATTTSSPAPASAMDAPAVTSAAPNASGVPLDSSKAAADSGSQGGGGGSGSVGSGNGNGSAAAAVQQLVVPGRDAPGLPLAPGLGPTSFTEQHIHAIVTCTGTSRRDAIAALKRAHNDAPAALITELERLRLNRDVLREMAEEYASYRGLNIQGKGAGEQEAVVDGTSGDVRAVGRVSLGGNGGSVGECVADPMECDGEYEDTLAGRTEGSGGNGRGRAQGSRQVGTSPGISSRGGGDRRGDGIGGGCVHPCYVMGGGGDSGGEVAAGTTVRAAAHALFPGRSDSRSPPAKVARCTGPVDASEGLAVGVAGVGPSNQAAPTRTTAAATPNRTEGVSSLQRVQALIMSLPQVAKAGGPRAVIDAAHQVAPGVLECRHPHLSWALWASHFKALLAAGDATTAMNVARTHMAPLATAHAELQPLLKAAMSSLLMGGFSGSGQAGTDGGSEESDEEQLAAVVGRVQAALQAELGLQGPRLLGVLQVLLGAHSQWLQAQRFNNPFLSTLGISSLLPQGCSVIPKGRWAQAPVGAADARAGRPFARPSEPRSSSRTLREVGGLSMGLARREAALAGPQAATQGAGAGASAVTTGPGAGSGVSAIVDAAMVWLRGTYGSRPRPAPPIPHGRRRVVGLQRMRDDGVGAGGVGGVGAGGVDPAAGRGGGNEDEMEEEEEEEDAGVGDTLLLDASILADFSRQLQGVLRAHRHAPNEDGEGARRGEIAFWEGPSGLDLGDEDHGEDVDHGVVHQEEEEVEEEDVSRVMEILAVPRTQALEMLVQHGGDVESAVMAFLQ